MAKGRGTKRHIGKQYMGGIVRQACEFVCISKSRTIYAGETMPIKESKWNILRCSSCQYIIGYVAEENYEYYEIRCPACILLLLREGELNASNRG